MLAHLFWPKLLIDKKKESGNIITKGGQTMNSNKPKPKRKPDTSLVTEMLTPSEIEQLQQEKKEDNAYFQKIFAANKPDCRLK